MFPDGDHYLEFCVRLSACFCSIAQFVLFYAIIHQPGDFNVPGNKFSMFHKKWVCAMGMHDILLKYFGCLFKSRVA
jgi:hypothetical protein